MTKEQAEVREQTRRILDRFGKKRGNLVPILQQVQGKLGYLPREAMLEIAKFLDMPDIDVLGAKRAGIFAVHFKTGDWPYPAELPKPDAVIEDLREIFDIIGPKSEVKVES